MEKQSPQRRAYQEDDIWKKKREDYKEKGNDDIWRKIIPGNENSKWKPETYLTKKQRSSATEAERATK